MKPLRAFSPPALVAALGCLAAACADAPPTMPPTASPPNLSHRPGHGGGGGGASVTVEFHGTITLMAGAPAPDYLAAGQTVKGTNSESRIVINNAPFQLTLAFAPEDLASCRPAPGSALTADDDRLDGLQALSPLTGLLSVTGWKTTGGAVVNFTYVDRSGAVLGSPGDEFFLTTGGGSEVMREEATLTRIARTGGYVRINRNGDPKDAVKCDGVDYEFTVTR